MLHFDIFCRVVDNFGDAGVCYRLARQLVDEHEAKVHLICDQPTLIEQLHGGRIAEPSLSLSNWDSVHETQADVVIAAFACRLPESVLQCMAQARAKPVWINLDYLSAEAWVESHHALLSPHPNLSLTEHFFFPGFTEWTGGLLRERDLIDQRDAARTEKKSTLDASLSVYLFAYPSAPIAALIDTFLVDVRVSKITHPQSVHVARTDPRIEAHVFTAQRDFDAMLWQHGVLFVRGEDSFVRAQWAGVPFVWQAYPQEDGAHWVKIEAFLTAYCLGLSMQSELALRALWQAWNAGKAEDIPTAWSAFVAQMSELRGHALAWSEKLASQTDLCTRLIAMVKTHRLPAD